jgi:hypothetical protein
MTRPVSITIIGWLFIAAGVIGFLYHLPELNLEDPFSNDGPLVLLVRLLAVAGGILVLRRFNIGRWLLVLWLSYHVVLSSFHNWTTTIIHLIFLLIIGYLLFRRNAHQFFTK